MTQTQSLKDPSSVSLYPYNRSQKLQYVYVLNALTLQKKLQTVVTNNVFLDKKVKPQQQQNKKSNIKTLGRAGI